MWSWCGSVRKEAWSLRVIVPRLSVVLILEMPVYSSTQNLKFQELNGIDGMEIKSGIFWRFFVILGGVLEMILVTCTSREIF